MMPVGHPPRTRVAVVTGASSGIGAACAAHLPLYGFRVYGLSRTTSPIRMDVANGASVHHAMRSVLAREGRIDAIVNCAGIALGAAIEDTSPEEAREVLDVNLLGALRVCREALPAMRAQGYGYILNIGSLAGLLGIPFQGLYSASKFALEGFTESLRLETRRFGIRVVLIEPGDYRTGLTTNRRFAQTQTPAYQREFASALKRMEHDEQHGPLPIHVARLVEKILNTRKPRLRYTSGPPLERAAALLKRAAPYCWVEKALRIYYSGLNGPRS